MSDAHDRSRAYELSCADCTFSTLYQGDLDGLFDVIEEHRAEMRSHPPDHFVEFEAVPRSSADPASD